MKNLSIVFLFAFSFLMASCSKDEGRNNANAKFEYKVNGVLVSYDVNNALSGEAAYIAKQTGRYVVNAQKGFNDVWLSQIIVDTLTANVYMFDSTANASGSGNISSVLHAGSQAMVYFSTDFVEFTITSHRNGSVSGTFRGKLTPMAGGLNYSNRGAVTISDGKIENLKVIY